MVRGVDWVEQPKLTSATVHRQWDQVCRNAGVSRQEAVSVGDRTLDVTSIAIGESNTQRRYDARELVEHHRRPVADFGVKHRGVSGLRVDGHVVHPFRMPVRSDRVPTTAMVAKMNPDQRRIPLQ